jgi:hypothetical protein
VRASRRRGSSTRAVVETSHRCPSLEWNFSQPRPPLILPIVQLKPVEGFFAAPGRRRARDALHRGLHESSAVQRHHRPEAGNHRALAPRRYTPHSPAAGAEPGAPRPKGSPASHPTDSSPHTLFVLHLARNERRNAPNGGCGCPSRRPESPKTGRARAMLVIDESVADRPDPALLKNVPGDRRTFESAHT